MPAILTSPATDLVGQGAGSASTAQERPTGGSCLQAPIGPRVHFACKLLLRLHEEVAAWITQSALGVSPGSGTVTASTAAGVGPAPTAPGAAATILPGAAAATAGNATAAGNSASEPPPVPPAPLLLAAARQGALLQGALHSWLDRRQDVFDAADASSWADAVQCERCVLAG